MRSSDAVTARITMVEALTLAGVSPAQANELISKLEAGAVAGARSWISENSPPHSSEQAFEDGWFQGVRAVASQLLQIADTTASQLRRAESNAQQLNRIRQQASRTPQAEEPAPAPAASAALDADEVLAVARRCTWACADPIHFFGPEASAEILTVALSAVRDEERANYPERLATFADQPRKRLEKMLRAYGPGSAPAEYGRYALVGQPESLVICERLETTPLLLQGLWDGELEDTFLADVAYAWGAHRHRPRR
ncbi:hypothetical protein GCM10017744_001360 [Streptomyces antimycoticus]|uniref:Uncharacterized protein n=1 Tax=Streptomyces antimycoticus TaxID=68175 RepID=A0A4D4KQV8_9ACTN|nr:hypothetical protein [Streptomyces antimycoticus]GDY48950.1 hypothetical protein SANT12839_098320 [Streptomyces antimycoticus]